MNNFSNIIIKDSLNTFLTSMTNFYIDSVLGQLISSRTCATG